MAEQKKETEGGCIDKNQLPTTTPVGIFTLTKCLKVNYDSKIIQPLKNGWYSIGFNHVIEPKEKIIIEVMPLSPRSTDNVLYFTLGFAPKGVINTGGHNQVGMYINGWNYHTNGHVYANCKAEKFNCPVGLQQKLRMEFQQHKITIFVENKEIVTFDVTNIFMDNKDKQFYPSLSVAGATVQIIDFTIMK